MHGFFVAVISAVIFGGFGAGVVAVPSTGYATIAGPLSRIAPCPGPSPLPHAAGPRYAAVTPLDIAATRNAPRLRQTTHHHPRTTPPLPFLHTGHRAIGTTRRLGRHRWISQKPSRLRPAPAESIGHRAHRIPPPSMLLTIAASTGKTPVLDVGAFSQIKARKIKIVEGVKEITKNGAKFVNGQEMGFDSIILATGYKSNVPSWLKGTDFPAPRCQKSRKRGEDLGVAFCANGRDGDVISEFGDLDLFYFKLCSFSN